MSFALDVNVLLYASDSAGVEYEKAREFLDSCIHGSDLFYLGWPTVMGYLRMATHPSIFAQPLSPEEAQRNVQGLIALPHVRLLSEAEGFWDVYRSVSGEVPVRGNLVPDAHLAALLRQHGVRTIYTRDRDFRKFDFLKVRDPFG
jgi:toxin-antitoxin system PIN domain toxin